MKAEHRDNALRLARIAVYAMFFTNGSLFANWIARIPTVRDNLGLTEGQLGLALLGASLGVIIGLPLAGGLIARYGSKRVTMVGASVEVIGLPFLALAHSGLMLAGILFVFGFGIAMMDIAMNTQSVEVERRKGKPILSSFHAVFSIGGVVGAGTGAILTTLGLGVMQHFLIASVLHGALVLVTVRWLLVIPEETSQQDARRSLFVFPTVALLPLGAIVFSAGLGEGAMADWSAIYLRDVVGTEESTAALGFAAFSAMMTIGRLSGDVLTARFNRVLLVRGGGALAAAGLLLALMWPSVVTALVGFGLVGAGISFIIPLAFSTAGNLPDVAPGRALAGVANIGYLAFLVGPPVIGLVADATSLRVSMGLVAALLLSLIFSAGAVRQHKQQGEVLPA